MRVLADYDDLDGAEHAASGGGQTKPLFMVYTPHVAHCPLQVPKPYLDKFAFMKPTDETACYTQSQAGFTPMTTEVYPGFGNDQADYSCRAQYAAMINFLDDNVAALVATLKAKQDPVAARAIKEKAMAATAAATVSMWDNTLIVFSSDNGGCILMTESGSTNYPLRGGKYSDFEGGTRAAAFVSGGFLPLAVRGTVSEAPVHISDW